MREMLANLRELLNEAVKSGSAVGHFNVINLEMARGVIMASEDEERAVILGIEDKQLDICPLDEFASFVIPMAEKAKVPVAVHFDRGQSAQTCMRALELGFTSVNLDCSRESLEQNIKQVAELVRAAKPYGASVEAELGYTPLASELEDEAATVYFTDPALVKRYVEETGVSALAVSVGTAHGVYKTQPKLDYDRIRAITSEVSTPIVLHGGSGLSDRAIRMAIESGISKIDIFTDLNIACCQGAIQATNDGVHLISEMIPYEVHAVRAVAAEKIRLFANRK